MTESNACVVLQCDDVCKGGKPSVAQLAPHQCECRPVWILKPEHFLAFTVIMQTCIYLECEGCSFVFFTILRKKKNDLISTGGNLNYAHNLSDEVLKEAVSLVPGPGCIYSAFSSDSAAQEVVVLLTLQGDITSPAAC